MKRGSFKLWRSPVACWALFVFFTIITFLWQIVDVVPYVGMERDYLIGSVAFGGAAVVFYFLARHAKRQ